LPLLFKSRCHGTRVAESLTTPKPSQGVVDLVEHEGEVAAGEGGIHILDDSEVLFCAHAETMTDSARADIRMIA
jgi:hypothetical protein